MLLKTCPKHAKDVDLVVFESYRKSGDKFFYVFCYTCGKSGPRRKTLHGAQMAWNEAIAKGETANDSI